MVTFVLRFIDLGSPFFKGRPCGPNRERIFPAFRFPLPWRFFKTGWWFLFFHPYLGKIPILTNIFQRGWNHQPENHWPGNSLRTLEMWGISPFKHLKAPAKKLRSLLPIFQTKIATTPTMTASKWRKEAYILFCGCATVIFPDFCLDETTIVFKLQIEALGEIWGKPKVQLFHH